jgi:excisionase family DNA binding protein
MRMIENTMIEPEMPVTKKEVAAYFKVTPRCVDQWMAAGLIPYIKIGRKCVRFIIADVKAHLYAKCGRNTSTIR